MDLTASAYTIAGSMVGAGVGEPSPWPFEVRVEAAAEAGYSSIGLFEADYAAMRASGTTDDELLNILDRHDMSVAEIEFMFDWAHHDELAVSSAGIRENLFHMAEVFRPHHLSLGEVRDPHELPPLDVVAKRFAAACDRVAPFGVNAVLEFLPWSGICDLVTSEQVVMLADRDNGGIYLDVWHYFRGPSDLAQLRSVDPRHIMALALNDAADPVGDPVEDTTRRRLLPGQGTFDLLGLLGAFRELGIEPQIAVEILSEEQAARHPREAARVSMEAAMKVLERAGYG